MIDRIGSKPDTNFANDHMRLVGILIIHNFELSSIEVQYALWAELWTQKI